MRRKSPSTRWRLTMPDGRVVYIYEQEAGRPRISPAALAAFRASKAERCPIESEAVVVQDGRVAPGAP